MTEPAASPPDLRSARLPTRRLAAWALLLPLAYLPSLVIGERSLHDLLVVCAAAAVALLAVRLLAAGRVLDRAAAGLEKSAPLLLALVVVAFAVAGAARAAAHLAAFHDLAIAGLFTQSFWTTLHGRLLFNSFEAVDGGVVSHFGVHFSPTLLLLTPFFALRPDASTLMAAQSAALALGAIPLFALLRRRAGGAGALLLVAALLATPLFAAAGGGDFHDSCFLVAPFLASVWAIETGHRGWLVLFVLLFLGVREDTGLTVAALGVYAALRGRGRGTAIALVAGGLAWFVIATRLVIPSFGSPSIVADPKRFFAAAFGQWGATPGAALLEILLHPVRVVRWLATRELAQYVYTLFLPFLLVPPLLDVTIVLAVPALAINLLSRFAFMHAAMEPYSYLPLTVLALATGSRAGRIATAAPADRRSATGLAAGILVLAGVLPATLNRPAPPPGATLPPEVGRRIVGEIADTAAVYVPNVLTTPLAKREHVDNAWNTGAVAHDAVFRARYEWIVLWPATEPRDSAMVRELPADPRFTELPGYAPLRVWRRR